MDGSSLPLSPSDEVLGELFGQLLEAGDAGRLQVIVPDMGSLGQGHGECPTLGGF